MTHLPLTPGEYKTRKNGWPACVDAVGRKWAHGHIGGLPQRWRVATGEHKHGADFDITGRVEPAPPDQMVFTSREQALQMMRDRAASYHHQKPLECWIGTYSNGEFPSMAARSNAAVREYNPVLRPVHMVEARRLDAVTAQRDEAAALLLSAKHNNGVKLLGEIETFLAKIGGK